jgi:hypothetical protein
VVGREAAAVEWVVAAVEWVAAAAEWAAVVVEWAAEWDDSSPIAPCCDGLPRSTPGNRC